MPPVGFETTISVGRRLQTYALDRAATGTGNNYNYVPTKTYHVIDKVWGKVFTLIPYAGSVFVVRYINL